MVLSYAFGISRRWEMMFLLMSGVIIVYTLRVNMSVAAPKMTEDLNWSESQKGYVLSAFYWGYAAGQIPFSRLAQIYGAKHLFGFSVIVPSILSMLVPIACKESYPVALFIRAILGFCESASFPCVFHFFPSWIPTAEKTSMIATVFSGMYVGEIIGFSLSGVLVDSVIIANGQDIGGWPSVFYVFGIVGILWYPYWTYMAYETPEEHPYMEKEELLLIRQGVYMPVNSAAKEDTDDLIVIGITNAGAAEHRVEMKQEASLDNLVAQADSSELDQGLIENLSGYELSRRTPWFNFFTSAAGLTLLLGHWNHGWVGFLLLSEMPSYFTSQLGFSLSLAGELCIVPYAALYIATMAFSELFGYLQRHHGWKTRTVRQWAHILCYGGSSLSLIACSFVSEPYGAFALIVLAQIFLGANQSGMACAYMDLAPKFSGPFSTVGNTLGAIAGVAGPIAVASFTDEWNGIWGWRAVFFLTGAMCAASLVTWVLFQDSDIRPSLNTPTPKRL